MIALNVSVPSHPTLIASWDRSVIGNLAVANVSSTVFLFGVGGTGPFVYE